MKYISDAILLRQNLGLCIVHDSHCSMNLNLGCKLVSSKMTLVEFCKC